MLNRRLELCLLVQVVSLSSACGNQSKKKTLSSNLTVNMSLAQQPMATVASKATLSKLNDVDPDTIDFTNMQNNPDRIPIDALARSLVPESLIYQIAKISTKQAATGNGGTTVYSCKGSTGVDCTVDLMDSVAVKALLADATVKVEKKVDENATEETVIDTVYSISVDQCPPGESNHTTKVKGKVDYMGYTWYTTSSDKVLTTQEADYGYVTITDQGCMGPEWVLPKTLELKDGQEQKVSLFVNLTDQAHFLFFAQGNGQGEMKVGTNRTVSIAYPDAVPVIGEHTPLVEEYRISTMDSAHPDTDGDRPLLATLLLFIDDDSQEPLGASCRSHFDGTNYGWTHCPAVQTISKNDSGDYTFTGNQWKTSIGGETEEVTFTSTFQRKTHSGTFVTNDYLGNGTKQNWEYTATAQ